MAKFGILRRRQRIEHLPLVVQLVPDVAHPRQVLDRLRESVRPHPADGAADLVNDQLDPELGDLVPDDEQHLVMMRRVAERHLRRQQAIELQVTGVIVIPGQVAVDRMLEMSFLHVSTAGSGT